MQGRTAGAQGPAEALGSPSGRGSTDVLAAGSHGVTQTRPGGRQSRCHGVTQTRQRRSEYGRGLTFEG